MASKQVAILCDSFGYTERRRALVNSGIEVYAVTTRDNPPEGYLKVTIPDSWLPEGDEMDYNKKCWFKANAIYLAAIQQFEIEADHYWIIEGDCVATVDRWRRLFADHKDNDADLCTGCLDTRFSLPQFPYWHTAPEWANLTAINALHRISRRAIDWNIAAAEEMRNTLSDATTASIVHRNSGSFCRINRTDTHYDNQTMRAQEKGLFINKNRINHPVKRNTYGFEGLNLP